MISIIVPYYNREEYLERCVNSITAQTYKDLQIILVNDGSTDGSVKVAEELAEKDNRIVNINITHGGVSNARNIGLTYVEGEYVMFVDSDDWVDKDIIRKLHKLMITRNADLTTCELMRVSSFEEVKKPANSKVTTYGRNRYLKVFFKIGSNEWVHYPVAKLYKKELLPARLYPENIRIGEDIIGTYQAIRETGKIVRLREVGYYYYKNVEGATGAFSDSDFDLISVWDEMVILTEVTDPDHSYAVLNRDRINFTLLSRMITSISRKEINSNEKYRRIEKELLHDLKKCKKELIHSPMVISRKAAIICLSTFYPVAAFFGNIFVKLRRLFCKR